MIYIVSGASRSGKSTIAQRFLEKTLIPYMPLDCMMMGFMNGIPSMGIHDLLWPNEIAEKIWPFLEAICKNMIYNQIDYMFEGEAVWPAHIKALSDCYPDQIKTCFLGFSDVDIVKKVSNVKQYPNHERDWLVSQTEDYIINHIENMKKYSLLIKEECLKFGFRYFDTSYNFENVLEEVLTYLDENNGAKI